MKKIKLFFPHIELRVMVSDKMADDIKLCENWEKRCENCSWRDIKIGSMNVCAWGDVRRLISEKTEG